MTAVARPRGTLLYHVLIGDIEGQRGHLGAAAQAFGKAAQETGDQGLAERSTLLSLYARRYAQAEGLAHLWLREDPQSLGAREALADALVGLGQLPAAEQGFRKALARATTAQGSAGRAFAFEHIATLLLRHKRTLQALAVMRVLAHDYRHDPVGAYALADLARRDRAIGVALSAIDKALALKPHWEDAAVLKARILWAATPRRALAFSARFLAANPGATRLRLDYARRLVSLQYWRRALAQFQIIARAAPNDPQVLYAAGLLALRTNALGLARTYFKRDLALAPDNPRTVLYLGEIAQRQRQFARAHYYYLRVTAPYRFRAAIRDALMLLDEAHPHQAWLRLSHLTARNRGQAGRLALARNEVLMALRHYRRGLAVLQAVAGQTRHPSVLLYAQALDEEKLGRVAIAEKDLERLVAAHPQSAVALNALGYTYISQGQHARRGLALARRALAIDPHNPDILDTVGWGYYRAGHAKRALHYLRKAFEVSPEPTIAAHLGAVFWRLGERAEALELWRAALRKAPQNTDVKAEMAKHRAL